MHIVIRTVVLQPVPQVSPRGRPVVYEKSLETPAIQVELVEASEVIVEGEHVEYASAPGYRQLRMILLLVPDNGCELILFGTRGQGNQHFVRPQVILPELPEGFLINRLAPLAHVFQGIFGHRTEKYGGCETEDSERNDERKKDYAPHPSLVK